MPHIRSKDRIFNGRVGGDLHHVGFHSLLPARVKDGKSLRGYPLIAPKIIEVSFEKGLVTW